MKARFPPSRKGLNFRREIWTSKVLPILTLIKTLYDSGESYCAKIGRLTGFGKKLVWYYLNRLEKAGYIRTDVKSSIKTYQLTQMGLNLLEWLERKPPPGLVRLEFLVLKYPVLSGETRPVDWRRVELRNWGQLHGRVCGVFVRRNPDSVEVFAEPVEGSNPYELYYYARTECDFIARMLERRFGMKLGIPEVSRRPQWATPDPAAHQFTENFNFKNEWGRMDRSQPRRVGEINWFSPEAANEYLLTPMRVRQIAADVKNLSETLENLKRKQAALHEQVKTLTDVTAQISKNLSDLVGILNNTFGRGVEPPPTKEPLNVTV